MYRVELKVAATLDGNEPHQFHPFLMYRVELKVLHGGDYQFSFFENGFLMYRVELKVHLLWLTTFGLQVPNVPCGVESIGSAIGFSN